MKKLSLNESCSHIKTSWASVKLESIVRLLMVHLLPGILPLYIVTEYPKSGGSWVAQMLSEYLRIPFPRNQFPKLTSSVIHGHYLYNRLLKNTFVVFRDGRDVMVSYYFQCLIKNDRFNSQLVDMTRRELKFDNYENVTKNLPAFINYTFMRKRYPRYSWSEFVNQWIDKKAAFIKYESLLRDAEGEMTRALYDCCNEYPDKDRIYQIAEKYSFKNQAGRNPGDEDRKSFLRKGIAGDWENYFSKEACEVFNNFAGKELISLGYESDDSWISKH